MTLHMDADLKTVLKKRADDQVVAIALLLCLLFVPAPQVFSNSLVTKPLKCVSLKEGQICTERVLIRWSSTQMGDYCLFVNQVVQPLACWNQTRSGEHRLIYKDNVDWVFTLRSLGDGIDIATSTFTIAWVYDRRRQRSGWRRFWKLF